MCSGIFLTFETKLKLFSSLSSMLDLFSLLKYCSFNNCDGLVIHKCVKVYMHKNKYFFRKTLKEK